MASFACAALLAGCGDSDSEGGTAGGAVPAAQLDSIRERLGDRMFEFGRAQHNSDRNAHSTGLHRLGLCKSGLFSWDERIMFSSSVGSFDTNDHHEGTWTLGSAAGQAVVDLKVERSTGKNPPAARRFVVTIAGDAIRFDGVAATESDLADACARAASEAQPK